MLRTGCPTICCGGSEDSTGNVLISWKATGPHRPQQRCPEDPWAKPHAAFFVTPFPHLPGSSPGSFLLFFSCFHMLPSISGRLLSSGNTSQQRKPLCRAPRTSREGYSLMLTPSGRGTSGRGIPAVRGSCQPYGFVKRPRQNDSHHWRLREHSCVNVHPYHKGKSLEHGQ